MKWDLQLREAARAIYDSCYPSEDWAPCSFDEAERFGTIHYRQAVGAAQRARAMLASRGEQLSFTAMLRRGVAAGQTASEHAAALVVD